MPLNFKRSSRLVNKEDFKTVLASPTKVYHRYLLVIYQFNRKNHARLGMMVRKLIIPQAVQRNRIRRVLRESFRQSQESLKGLDIVVVMRSKCTPLRKADFNLSGTEDNQVLRNDMDYLWHRLRTSLKEL